MSDVKAEPLRCTKIQFRLGRWGSLQRFPSLGGRHCTAGQYGYVPLGRHLAKKVTERSNFHRRIEHTYKCLKVSAGSPQGMRQLI